MMFPLSKAWPLRASGYGSRFLADEFESAGRSVGERRVWGRCRDQSPRPPRRRVDRPDFPGPVAHYDFVNRDFPAAAPNKVWLTEVAEPHRRGQCVLVCDQGPVLEPHRRLRHQGSRNHPPRRRRWPTCNERRNEITCWTAHTCNFRRRQLGLGRLTRVEFEFARATATLRAT